MKSLFLSTLIFKEIVGRTVLDRFLGECDPGCVGRSSGVGAGAAAVAGAGCKRSNRRDRGEASALPAGGHHSRSGSVAARTTLRACRSPYETLPT